MYGIIVSTIKVELSLFCFAIIPAGGLQKNNTLLLDAGPGPHQVKECKTSPEQSLVTGWLEDRPGERRWTGKRVS